MRRQSLSTVLRAGIVLFAVLLSPGVTKAQNSEQDALVWEQQYNSQAQIVYYQSVEADWTYNTNLTDYNLQKSLEAADTVAAFDRSKADEAARFDWENFENETLKREFSKIVDIGYSVLPAADFQRMNALNSEMQRIYSVATVCNRPGDDSGTCYPLDPDLTAIMASSTDWDELLWAWEGWRNVSGRLMPDMYEEFVSLLNQAAVLNGYSDNGDYWRSWYEDEAFRAECERIWIEVSPLYQQLHAYVRRKLQERFPAGNFPTEGHIPAHLLGNMWAQQWDELESLVRPFPDQAGVDVTDEMIAQGYDADRMFRLSEEFFTSLGLIAMPQEFWDKTMMTKPTDRDVVCHASAWDFYNTVDFRIKQCTEVDMGWLMTTHHEMGHIEYFLQYAIQPVQFRDGANPGFHEAIGDTLALSVNTPEHLQAIGLLIDFEDDPDGDLNFLMQMALQKLAFLPFGYLIDQWRWDVFAGAVTRDEYNSKWWDVRCKYQGVSPPVARSTYNDFDPGAKYHVPANTPYIRYFVSHILQFQFHKALCEAAGNTNPLHRCDIYQSLDAGTQMSNMMKLGSSQPWQDALEQITGSRDMKTEPLMEYFAPLYAWLQQQNEGHVVGWTEECPTGSIVP
jgi:peptidyl-dipeptidase A